MAEWWQDKPEERYWTEITDRVDVGESLWAPNKNVWHYSSIKSVNPGDMVFHYKD